MAHQGLVGFTGTRKGLTDPQLVALRDLLSSMKVNEFHHGDCVGSDALAHKLVYWLFPNVKMNIHPPTNSKLRARCKIRDPHFGTVHPPKPYLVRNKDIVNSTELLIATPAESQERAQSGGTWSTIRYARSLGRKVYLILPDGEVVEENPLPK